MKVQGSCQVPGTAGQVFDLLLDPEVLASCIPGCQELVNVGEGLYTMKMKVAIAAITGDFSGNVKISDTVRPETFQMSVDGSGRIGHLKGSGRVRVAEEDSATTVSWEGDVQVGGPMAAVGQRLMDTTSKMIIRNFFNNLSKRAGLAASAE